MYTPALPVVVAAASNFTSPVFRLPDSSGSSTVSPRIVLSHPSAGISVICAGFHSPARASRRTGRLRFGRHGAKCNPLLATPSAVPRFQRLRRGCGERRAPPARRSASAAWVWPHRAGGLDLSAVLRGPGEYGLSRFRQGLVSGNCSIAVTLPHWPAQLESSCVPRGGVRVRRASGSDAHPAWAEGRGPAWAA